MFIVYNPTRYVSYVAFTPHYYYFKNTFLVYYLHVPSLNPSNIFFSLKPLTWGFPYLYHSSWDLRKGNPFSSFTSQLTYHSRKIFLVYIIYSFCPILVIFCTHLFMSTGTYYCIRYYVWLVHMSLPYLLLLGNGLPKSEDFLF